MKPCMPMISVMLGSLLLLAFAFGSAVNAQSCIEPRVGLVAWWPGDGDGDEIATAHSTTLFPDVTFVDGVVGQAFHVSGDSTKDIIESPSSSSLGITGPITIAMWVERPPLGEMSINKTPDGTHNSGYGLKINAAGFVHAIAWGQFTHQSQSPVVPADTLKHVAWTYDKDAGESRIYIDGVLESIQLETVAMGGNNSPVLVSGSGTVDEIEVYNRALSPGEIDTIYNSPRCRPPRFDPPVVIPADSNAGRGVIADFNEDGHDDIALPDFYDRTVRIFLGDGTGQFAPFSGLSADTTATSVDAADFDLDGHVDLVVSHLDPKSLILFKGDGTGSFVSADTLGLSEGSFRVRAGDLNLDGNPDIVATINHWGTFRVFMGQGDLTFEPVTEPDLGCNLPHDALIVDVDEDNLPDVVSVCNSSSKLSVNIGNGDGTFQPASVTSLPVSSETVGLGAGDFDGDGHVDLAITVVNLPDSHLYLVAFGDGSGAFPNIQTLGGRREAWSIAVGDWNGDGKLDLARPSGIDDVVQLKLGRGDGTFFNGITLATDEFPYWVEAGDFNEDDLLDIVVGHLAPSSGGASLMVFLQREPDAGLVGSVEGRVSADCPAEDTGLLGVQVDLFEDGTGDLIGSDVTDADGLYEVPEVPSGDYTVTVVTPLGYSAASEEIPVVITGGQAAIADFPLSCLEITAEPRTIGFWKHQVGVATGGNGNAQIDGPTLCALLDDVDLHFNGNPENPVIVYEPPASGLCDDKLEEAKRLLNLRGSVDMIDRAKQQLLAVLLNVVSERLAITASISEDGATLSQAVTYSDNLIDDPSGDHELAKSIADDINNGKVVASGVIPLETPNIAYDRDPGTLRRLPAEFHLSQSRPNPFRSETTIRLAVPSPVDYTLSIYDISGRLVRRYANAAQPGVVSIVWDGRDEGGLPVVAGVYFYRAEAGEFTATKKLLLVR